MTITKLNDADPIVSIVIPTFNSAQYLGNLVQNLKEQSLQQWEAIFVDDCSTDDTVLQIEEIVREDTRFRLIKKLQRDGYPSKSRNMGIEAAKSPLIALMDHDDLWHAQKLKLQYAVTKRYRDFAIIHTASHIFAEHRPVSNVEIPIPSLVLQNDPIQLFTGCYIIASSTMIAKDKLLDVGCFATGKEYCGVDDYHLWLKLAFKGPIVKIDFPMTYWRVHSASLGANKGIFRRGLWSIANSIELANLDEKLLNRLKAQALRTEGAEQMVNHPLSAVALILASFCMMASVKTIKVLIYSFINVLLPHKMRMIMFARVRSG